MAHPVSASSNAVIGGSGEGWRAGPLRVRAGSRTLRRGHCWDTEQVHRAPSGNAGATEFRLGGRGETRVVGNAGRRDAGSAAPAGQCGAPGSCASVPGTARPVRSGARDCASRGLGEEKPTGSQSRAGLPVVGISMRDRRRPAFGFRRRLRVGSTNAGRTARRQARGQPIPKCNSVTKLGRPATARAARRWMGMARR